MFTYPKLSQFSKILHTLSCIVVHNRLIFLFNSFLQNKRICTYLLTQGLFSFFGCTQMCLISQAKKSNLFSNFTRDILSYANRDHRNKCTLQLQNLDLYVHVGNCNMCYILVALHNGKIQTHIWFFSYIGKYLKQSQTDVRKWRSVYIILWQTQLYLLKPS